MRPERKLQACKGFGPMTSRKTSVYLALSPQQIWLVPLPTGWYNFLLTVNVSHPNISIQTLHTVLKVLTKRTCLDIKSFNTSFIFPDFNVWFRGDNVWRELMKLWENLSKFIPDTQKKTLKKKTHIYTVGRRYMCMCQSNLGYTKPPLWMRSLRKKFPMILWDVNSNCY